MNVFKILDKLDIYVILHIISFFSFVPSNLKQITQRRLNRFKNNKLIFKTRKDIIDQTMAQSSLFYIYDRHMIYSDLELVGFRQELNIIKMFYKMPNKNYLRKFFYLFLKKNNVTKDNADLRNKNINELYQIYLHL